MTLNIAPQMFLTDVQDAFHKKFPFLKLAFFTQPHAVHEGSHAKFLISDRSKKIKDVIPELKEEKKLIFDNDTKVQDLESAFEKNFGLHVQVFVKSGNVWLLTTSTDDLTLAELSEKSKSYESHELPIAEPMDYREQD